MGQDEAFAGFRRSYGLRPPATFAGQNEDQRRQMSEADGLRLLDVPSPGRDAPSPGPWGLDQAAAGRHLWVVGPTDVPYALEACPFGRTLESSVIKHTNLTGGGEAHCGGELWFLQDGSVVVGGSSGRYGPRSREELLDVGAALEAMGYEVGVLDWSEDMDAPPMYVKSRKGARWLRDDG